MPLWVADERGLYRGGERVGAPCAALDARDGRVWTAGAARGERLTADGKPDGSFAAPPGVSRVAAGDYLYALSADADSVTAFDGALCPALTAPAGDFPRDLCVSGDGRRLLIAGGASGTAILMDNSLRVMRAYALPGVVSAACFTRDGFAALCAPPGEEMRASLIAVRRAGTAETLITLPGAPCALCVLANGDCVVGVTGEILRLRGRRVIYRLPSPCPTRIRAVGDAALVVDLCEGTARLVGRPPGAVVYRGAPRDALMLS